MHGHFWFPPVCVTETADLYDKSKVIVVAQQALHAKPLNPLHGCVAQAAVQNQLSASNLLTQPASIWGLMYGTACPRTRLLAVESYALLMSCGWISSWQAPLAHTFFP